MDTKGEVKHQLLDKMVLNLTDDCCQCINFTLKNTIKNINNDANVRSTKAMLEVAVNGTLAPFAKPHSKYRRT